MTTIELQVDAIYSDMGDDPDFGELVELYVSEMPDRVAVLENALATGDRELLQRTAHQMKGASGSYGFPQLTPYAAQLEGAVRDAAPEDEILEALSDLVAMCNKVRAGAPA